MAVHSGTPAGLLLTGGASRRMGRDKALLEVDGRRLADRAAATLGAVCDPVLEVGPGYTIFPATREDPPGAGPLAALGAGWGELTRLGCEGPVLVLALDMPFVGEELLRLLASRPGPPTAVPLSDGEPQPLCARYGAEALARISGLVAAGERSLRALLAAVEVAWIEPAEWEPVAGPQAFADLDTPADVRRFFP
jgi:molybdopterin-guanine dinucleotide biosynthesis protein A